MKKLPYCGGKRLLAKSIIAKFPPPQTYSCYIEPFAGGAGVYFAKSPSEVEILNDLNRDLTDFYNSVKYHPEEFIKCFKWSLNSRHEFDRFMKMDSDAIPTTILRAARFYYLLKNCFGSKVYKQNFAPSCTEPPRLNLFRIEEDITEMHLRMSNTWVENLPYEKLIEKYNKPHVLFYLDSPYWDVENYYGAGIFSKSDFTKLRDACRTIKGKFIYSINDAPEIRELFKEFHIKEIPTRYSLAGGNKQKVVKELLIFNYDPSASRKS